jgi:hypothetical protein
MDLFRIKMQGKEEEEKCRSGHARRHVLNLFAINFYYLMICVEKVLLVQ